MARVPSWVRVKTPVNFRLGSIPVRLRPEFFLIGIISLSSVGMEKGLIWVAIVFVSVLLHELGHAMAMRAFGYAPSIELHMLGGRTSWPEGARPSDKQKLIVTLCGPGIELLAAIVAFIGLTRLDLPPLADWARTQFIYVNFLWALVNMLPILPWDGGHALDSTVSLITKNPRPRGVGMVSMLFGAAAIAAALALFNKNIMLIYLGAIGVWKGWQRWSGNEPGVMPAEAETAWNLSTQGQHEQAAALLTQTLAGSKDPAVRLHLLEVLAWVKLAANDVTGCERVLRELGPDVARVSPELRARVAAHRQEPHRVVELLAAPAAANRLRPEAWPLLVSAVEDERKLDEIVTQAVSRLALAPAEQEIASSAAAKLFQGGHIPAALLLCQRAFEVCKAPVFAFNAACCLCRLGQVDQGLVWLTRAVKAGYKSPVSLEEDPDLAPLRALPGFAALRDEAKSAAS